MVTVVIRPPEREGTFPRPVPPPAVAVFVDRFPQLSETFVAGEAAALGALGHAVAIESRARAQGPATELPVRYVEDETRARRLAALVGLVARHPRRAAADAALRRRVGGEPLRRLAPRALRLARTPRPLHLHAHFAWEAAADALRIGRLIGAPVSITAHGADIYAHPDRLAAKLAAADFVTSGSDSTVRDLPAGQVFKIVMGVDGEVFRRRAPHPGGRHVAGVGRLVEKKGFIHLVRAAARLGDVTVTIAGEGPERGRLEDEIERLGVGARVTLAGALEPDGVRALLERADLLAMPCVVARDGDRDSMPVVVKEALAMEVCVVASDTVGLPEVVREPWGTLVPPGDDEALARAIAEALAADRAEAGRAGRAYVLEHAALDRETARLAALIRKRAGGP